MNLKRIALAIVALFAVNLSANAAEVDLKKSTFKWKAFKKIGSGHHGQIFLTSAKANIKGDTIQSGEFVMDMTSFTADDLEGEWNKKFMGHVKSGDFFLVDKHPKAKLSIKKQINKNTVIGTLTIKDITKPIKIKFSKSGKTYTGRMEFNRTDYEIKYGSESFFGKLKADKIIKDIVHLEFKIVLK